MADKVWVKAAHPRASFYQEVIEPSESGGPAELKIEHVRAETVLGEGHPDHGKQVPVPVQVSDTAAVRIALLETFPGTDRPARIVKVDDKEVREYLKSIGKELEVSDEAPKKGKKAAAAAGE